MFGDNVIDYFEKGKTLSLALHMQCKILFTLDVFFLLLCFVSRFSVESVSRVSRLQVNVIRDSITNKPIRSIDDI